eukprot:SAG22_NODE_314_length_12607_cov_177.638311_8_plen_493_part_01
MAPRGRMLPGALLCAAAATGIPGAGAQFERPRFYCVEQAADPDGELCVDGQEYEVTRLVPNEGYVQMSGQSIAILGSNFPPQNVAELQCQIGEGGLNPVTVISPTEVRCSVPVLPGGDAGETPLLSLVLPGGGVYTDPVVMGFRLKEPDDGQRGGSNIVTPLDVLGYVNWAGVALGVVGMTVAVIFYRRRRMLELSDVRARRNSQSGGGGDATTDSLASTWTGGSAKAVPPGLTERLTEGGGDAAVTSSGSSKGGGSKCARFCGGSRCCILYGSLSVFSTLVSIGAIILMGVIQANLAGPGDAVEDFNTLVLGAVASTSLAVSWSYPTPNPPGLLAYEVQLRQDTAATDYYTTFVGPDESFTFTGLQASTSYLFRLRYIEGGIPTAWSTDSAFTTAGAALPAPPATTTVVGASADSLTLTWGMAADNGDAIVEYVVEPVAAAAAAAAADSSAAKAKAAAAKPPPPPIVVRGRSGADKRGPVIRRAVVPGLEPG